MASPEPSLSVTYIIDKDSFSGQNRPPAFSREARPLMWRAILEPALLFATPFVVYALFQLAQRRWPFVSELWSRGVVSTLTIAGLVTAIVGMVALGLLSSRNLGAYVPAHIENGRLAPGRFQ